MRLRWLAFNETVESSTKTVEIKLPTGGSQEYYDIPEPISTYCYVDSNTYRREYQITKKIVDPEGFLIDGNNEPLNSFFSINGYDSTQAFTQSRLAQPEGTWNETIELTYVDEEYNSNELTYRF